MKTIQNIRMVGICIAFSVSIYGCNSEDPDQGLAEACLKAYGKENLKDPQGAYLIDFKKEKSNEITITYSALNSIGGRDRGVARCDVKNNYELDERSSQSTWLIDRIEDRLRNREQ